MENVCETHVRLYATTGNEQQEVEALLARYSTAKPITNAQYKFAAASIAGLMITTEAMIADIPAENPEPAPQLGGMGGMGGMM